MNKNDLHGYQEYSVEFIKQHKTAAIFLDCGCGKTVITLTAINDLIFDRFEVRKVLVICPLRVGQVWKHEAQKWDHLDMLKLSTAIGTEKERLAALNTKADIYIINRENIAWLTENTKFDFDMIVIDELSSFKDHNSKRFKALMKVRPKVKRIVGLTGTPSGNGLMDLYAEFRLLDMGERLGRFIGQYRNTYFRPEKMNGNIVYSYKPLPDAEKKIYEKISDITISMKAADHLKMPELISTEFPVYLSAAEHKKYTELREELAMTLDDEEITAANAAVLAGKLSQLANGAIYSDDGKIIEIHDRKLDALEDIIESMNGRPLLVAYWYKHDYDRIAKRLTDTKIGFSKLDTEESIRRWNAGKLTVALIHPAAAGHGLNLQSGGSAMVWFGLTWSLELYQQTVARLWRQGQTSESVVIQHIITKGTIDEKIMKALRDKDTVQSKLIDAVKADLGGEYL